MLMVLWARIVGFWRRIARLLLGVKRVKWSGLLRLRLGHAALKWDIESRGVAFRPLARANAAA